MKTKIIAWLTGLLTISLAAFGFVLSFNALTDLAAQHGISIPWLFPLIVEAAVIVFSLNATYRSLYGESAKWQWGLIIGSSLLAGTFNVLHSQPDLISRAMSAMPSLFLLLSFETFLGQVKHAVKLTNSVKSLAELGQEIEDKRIELDKLILDKGHEITQLVTEKTAELDTKQNELDKLNGQIDQFNAKLEAIKGDIKVCQIEQKHRSGSELTAAKLAKIDQRRDKVLSLLGEGLSPDDIATELDVTVRTIKRDIVALNGSAAAVKGMTK